MGSSINGTGVAFSDSTSQASAWIGGRGQVFTSSGTFTIPTGVTAVKVTVVGGGGGSGGINGCSWSNGTAGGASSVSSGSQSISTISATGGAAGTGGNNDIRNGGVGSGGDINGYGGPTGGSLRGLSGSILSFMPVSGAGVFGSGGSYPLTSEYNGTGGGHAIKFLTGLTPGATLTVTRGAGGTGGATNGVAGGNGAIIFEW